MSWVCINVSQNKDANVFNLSYLCEIDASFSTLLFVAVARTADGFSVSRVEIQNYHSGRDDMKHIDCTTFRSFDDLFEYQYRIASYRDTVIPPICADSLTPDTGYKNQVCKMVGCPLDVINAVFSCVEYEIKTTDKSPTAQQFRANLSRVTNPVFSVVSAPRCV